MMDLIALVIGVLAILIGSSALAGLPGFLLGTGFCLFFLVSLFAIEERLTQILNIATRLGKRWAP